MSKSRNNPIELAEVFKALSHPHRLTILRRLVDCCPPGTKWDEKEQMGACVGDLGEGLGIAASTLSHHIKELRRVGIIQVERRGQKVECMIDPEKIQMLVDFFSELTPDEGHRGNL